VLWVFNDTFQILCIASDFSMRKDVGQHVEGTSRDLMHWVKSTKRKSKTSVTITGYQTDSRKQDFRIIYIIFWPLTRHFCRGREKVLGINTDSTRASFKALNKSAVACVRGLHCAVRPHTHAGSEARFNCALVTTFSCPVPETEQN
jgi:hypothetical protein